MTRIDQVADDVTELKVMVGKIITIQEVQQKSLDGLESQMSTALIPVQFAKWTIAAAGGLSVIVGLVYGVVQIAQAVAIASP